MKIIIRSLTFSLKKTCISALMFGVFLLLDYKQYSVCDSIQYTCLQTVDMTGCKPTTFFGPEGSLRILYFS